MSRDWTQGYERHQEGYEDARCHEACERYSEKAMNCEFRGKTSKTLFVCYHPDSPNGDCFPDMAFCIEDEMDLDLCEDPMDIIEEQNDTIKRVEKTIQILQSIKQKKTKKEMLDSMEQHDICHAVSWSKVKLHAVLDGEIKRWNDYIVRLKKKIERIEKYIKQKKKEKTNE